MASMNAEDTIGRAVRSALAQPEAVQVIVIDDGHVIGDGDDDDYDVGVTLIDNDAAGFL